MSECMLQYTSKMHMPIIRSDFLCYLLQANNDGEGGTDGEYV